MALKQTAIWERTWMTLRTAFHLSAITRGKSLWITPGTREASIAKFSARPLGSRGLVTTRSRMSITLVTKMQWLSGHGTLKAGTKTQTWKRSLWIQSKFFVRRDTRKLKRRSKRKSLSCSRPATSLASKRGGNWRGWNPKLPKRKNWRKCSQSTG